MKAATAGAATLRSTLLLGGMALAALAQPMACKQPAGEQVPQAQTDALAQVGPGVILPAADAFAEAVDGLVAATAAWQAAAEAGDGDAARASAQAAWRDAFLAWQVLELMQIGPIGSSLTTAGGQDLRDEIYSWPTINPCRVDEETLEQGYLDAAFFDDSLVNVMGLDALEHLLWADEDNACSASVALNADGSWAALDPAEIGARRAAYGAVTARRLRLDAARVSAAWDLDQGDFAGALLRAGDGQPYESSQQALNAVFSALFYIDSQTKDRKVATPLGLQGCDAAPCPEAVEARESGASLDAVLANLDGFQQLFEGGDGAGLDDLLVSIGEGALAEQVQAALADARAAAQAIDGPLDIAVVEDPAGVQALYDALDALTTPLETDVATVLTLEVPSEVAGDND